MTAPVVVSYGGGDNSTAMVIGGWERGERIDAIVFADTGDEMPHTYAYIWQHFQPWLERVGLPSLQIVRGSQPQQVIDGSLSAECLRLGTLPSKALGYGSCSEKWKQDPANRWLKAQGYTEKPVKWIGYHAGERERAANKPEDAFGTKRYPLLEWEWGIEECLAAMTRVGLPRAGKSACSHCPSMKKREILQLRRRYPDRLRRALEIERRALSGEGPALHTAKGLGRHFSWQEFLDDYDARDRFLGIYELDADTVEQCDSGCMT